MEMALESDQIRLFSWIDSSTKLPYFAISQIRKVNSFLVLKTIEFDLRTLISVFFHERVINNLLISDCVFL